jgi:hypothetical protein
MKDRDLHGRVSNRKSLQFPQNSSSSGSNNNNDNYNNNKGKLWELMDVQRIFL